METVTKQKMHTTGKKVEVDPITEDIVYANKLKKYKHRNLAIRLTYIILIRLIDKFCCSFL